LGFPTTSPATFFLSLSPTVGKFKMEEIEGVEEAYWTLLLLLGWFEDI
jgi:hypothetical protein